MMHESNSPQLVKTTGDLDLFRAVLKLKALLTANTITRETFLVNRRALLGFSEASSRAISNLTRNDELADAITEALTRPHIARVFSAGGWRKLATGRLFGVGARPIFS
jgi:triphosphoribosyl-dephospho-CoA synthetase